jgi:hypothetical protein
MLDFAVWIGVEPGDEGAGRSGKLWEGGVRRLLKESLNE